MKNVFLLLASVFLTLAGCSSSPTVADNSDRGRTEYVQEVRSKLNDLEKKTNDYRLDKAADVRASINDARAEVRSLETASMDGWYLQKDKVQTRMDRIEQKMKSAE